MHDILFSLIWIALGGAVGGMTRFFVSGFVGRRIGETFPWGTMTVNVTGAFAIGLMAAAADARLIFDAPGVWALVVTGFLGAYTTVSSFSLQTLALARDGNLLRASVNIVLSLVLCLAAAALGFGIGADILVRSAP